MQQVVSGRGPEVLVRFGEVWSLFNSARRVNCAKPVYGPRDEALKGSGLLPHTDITGRTEVSSFQI